MSGGQQADSAAGTITTDFKVRLRSRKGGTNAITLALSGQSVTSSYGTVTASSETATNHPPVWTSTSVPFTYLTAATFPASAMVSDEDSGQLLSVTRIAGADSGGLSWNSSSEQFEYDGVGAIGTVSWTMRVTDNGSPPQSANATIVLSVGQATIPDAWAMQKYALPTQVGLQGGLLTQERTAPSAASKHLHFTVRESEEAAYLYGGDTSYSFGTGKAGSDYVKVLWKFSYPSRLFSYASPSGGWGFTAGELYPRGGCELVNIWDTTRDVFWKVMGDEANIASEDTTPGQQVIRATGYWNPSGGRWTMVGSQNGDQSVPLVAVDTDITLATEMLNNWGLMRRGVYDPVGDCVWIGYSASLYKYVLGDTSTGKFYKYNSTETGASSWQDGTKQIYLGGEPTTRCAIDAVGRRLWIFTARTGATTGIWQFDISNVNAPTVDWRISLPAAWETIEPDDPAGHNPSQQTMMHKWANDSMFFWMASHQLLMLFGPGQGYDPPTIYIDPVTQTKFDGPDLLLTSAGSGGALDDLWYLPANVKVNAQCGEWCESRQEVFYGWGVFTASPRRAFAVAKPVSLPSWVPSEGVVTSITPSDGLYMSDYNPCPSNTCPYTPANDPIEGTSAGSGQNAVIRAWNSGAYADDFSEHGAMIFRGAGDGDYWGNECYAFDLTSSTWSRLSDPSSTIAADGHTQMEITDTTWVEYSDGRPAVGHTYDAYEYLNAGESGLSKGQLVQVQTTYGRKGTYNTGGAHYVDLSDGTDGRYSTNTTTLPGSSPLPFCFKDTLRRRIWRGHSNATYLRWMQYDGSTALGALKGWSSTLNITAAPWTNSANNNGAVAEYFPDEDIAIIVAPSSAGVLGLWAIKLDSLPWPTLTLTVDDSVSHAAWGGGGFGLAYVPETREFWIANSSVSDQQTLYRLTPPDSSVLTGTWTVTPVVMTGTTVSGYAVGGIYKKFRYAHKTKCLVWLHGLAPTSNGPLYAFRVPGTS